MCLRTKHSIFPLSLLCNLFYFKKNFLLALLPCLILLPFVTKLLKRTVTFTVFISSPLILFYTHSTESALFKVPNDLLVPKHNGRLLVRILFDSSAAFDTADYLFFLAFQDTHSPDFLLLQCLLILSFAGSSSSPFPPNTEYP